MFNRNYNFLATVASMGWLSSSFAARSGVENVTENIFSGGIGGSSQDADQRVQEIFAKASQAFAEGLIDSFSRVLSDMDVDMEHLARKISKAIEKSAQGIDFSGTTETVGSKFSEGAAGFFDGLALGDLMQDVGGEFRSGINGFSGEISEGLGEASRKFLWEVSIKNLPYIVTGTVCTTGSWLGIQYLYELAKHSIGRPKLATEICQLSFLSPITSKINRIGSFLSGAKEFKPIYNEKISRKIDHLIESVSNIRKNGGYFQNVLFYGPGGTGKTMISEQIAKSSGMSYVKMSGGDLAQYIKRGEHVTELNKLMDKITDPWRPWSSEPWVLFIDEAESLCRDRSKMPSTELLELQNAFLNRTGTQSKNFMLVLATNRMEDLDEAVLSRLDHKIYIGPPAKAERAKILGLYSPQFFNEKEQKEFFSQPQLERIAEETEGFTGRALFKMLNAIASKKACSKNNQLTQPMIDEVVRDFVEQEKEIEELRALKEAAKSM